MAKSLKCLFLCGLLLAAAGCSNHKVPAGRWEGVYDDADVMVAVRLEIARDGSIYLSAPDAFNLPPLNDAQRASMHQRLASELAAAWGEAAPRNLDFDGRTFRKPGGVAPQLEWLPDSRQMVAVVYLERRPGIRVRLRAVNDFSANPWSS